MSGDYDRRSKVSSYYDRPSFDQGHGRNASAGYNPTSFVPPARQAPLKGGRDEEEPMNPQMSPQQPDDWDVYADFNNMGPRYASSALPTPASFSSTDAKG